MSDFVIVGSGMFGSVCAERLAAAGYRVLVFEKRDHVGGNCWSAPDAETGIEVHAYGSHIFHTSDEKVWTYINRFTSFNAYQHSVLTTYRDRVYSMPINLGTINAYYDLNLKPYEVDAFLARERGKEQYDKPKNLEEQAVSLIGRPLYEAFIRGYTIKQWEKDPKDLPAEIITRLPVRYSYNCRYFNDRYEGIPLNGYGGLFSALLNHENIEVRLATDWFSVCQELPPGQPVIYTGGIDRFFNYKYGRLEWRSIELEREVHDLPDFQGCAVMNYADENIPFTRIHEFKHYHPDRLETNKTVIFKEYSKIISQETEPFYPVNTPRNLDLLQRYRKDAESLPNIHFGGRLGAYRYLDMDDTIAAALELVDRLLC